MPHPAADNSIVTLVLITLNRKVVENHLRYTLVQLKASMIVVGDDNEGFGSRYYNVPITQDAKKKTCLFVELYSRIFARL